MVPRCMACGKVLTESVNEHKCDTLYKSMPKPDLQKRFNDFDLKK